MNTPPPPGVAPWGRAELFVLAASALTGASLVVWAWIGVNGRVTVRDQIPWLNLAVMGVVLAGGANAIVLASVRRRVRTARRAVVRRVQQFALPLPAAEPASTGPVTAALMTWYHDPACTLMRFKQPVAEGAAAAKGRVPCPACHLEARQP